MRVRIAGPPPNAEAGQEYHHLAILGCVTTMICVRSAKGDPGMRFMTWSTCSSSLKRAKMENGRIDPQP